MDSESVLCYGIHIPPNESDLPWNRGDEEVGTYFEEFLMHKRMGRGVCEDLGHAELSREIKKIQVQYYRLASSDSDEDGILCIKESMFECGWDCPTVVDPSKMIAELPA